MKVNRRYLLKTFIYENHCRRLFTTLIYTHAALRMMFFT